MPHVPNMAGSELLLETWAHRICTSAWFLCILDGSISAGGESFVQTKNRVIISCLMCLLPVCSTCDTWPRSNVDLILCFHHRNWILHIIRSCDDVFGYRHRCYMYNEPRGFQEKECGHVTDLELIGNHEGLPSTTMKAGLHLTKWLENLDLRRPSDLYPTCPCFLKSHLWLNLVTVLLKKLRGEFLAQQANKQSS